MRRPRYQLDKQLIIHPKKKNWFWIEPPERVATEPVGMDTLSDPTILSLVLVSIASTLLTIFAAVLQEMLAKYSAQGGYTKQTYISMEFTLITPPEIAALLLNLAMRLSMVTLAVLNFNVPPYISS